MKHLLQPVRDEHQTLLPHIEALRTAADAVGTVDLLELRVVVDKAHHFLVHHLLPHAEAEDAVLYPAIDRLLAKGATATMSRDHEAVASLTDELVDLRLRLATVTETDEHLLRELRRILYGLHAIVALHFTKEDELYLPLLEHHLTDASTTVLLAELHRAEQAFATAS